MTRYEILLFFHIAFAIIWLGAGFVLLLQGSRAERAKDEAAVKRIFDDVTGLSTLLFIPASLLTLVFGIALVADGPWSFDQLWIILGLAGYAATFGTGMFVLKPRSEKVVAMTARAGRWTPEATLEARRILTLAQIDYVVLFLVVADMALKPTAGDEGTLAAMAAILAAAVVYTIVRARSLGIRAVRAPEPAS